MIQECQQEGRSLIRLRPSTLSTMGRLEDQYYQLLLSERSWHQDTYFLSCLWRPEAILNFSLLWTKLLCGSNFNPFQWVWPSVDPGISLRDTATC